MNNSQAKKLRKMANKTVRLQFDQLLETLCKSPWYVRLQYAFKIIFKRYNKIRFGHIATARKS